MSRKTYLQLDRFCGRHVHPIRAVETYVSRQEGSTLLNLEFHCGSVEHETVPEDESLGSRTPTIEVWIPVPGVEPAELDEHRAHLAKTYRADHDAFNRLYVFEHQGWWAIDVYLQVIDGRLWVECDGIAHDPNWYDGSKPETRVTLRGWVDLDAI